VNDALDVVAVTMVGQLLRRVSVVMTVDTQSHKVVQEWVEVLLADRKHQGQLNQQSKYKQAGLTHRQSLDIFNED
jgi:hypothetical protein